MSHFKVVYIYTGWLKNSQITLVSIGNPSLPNTPCESFIVHPHKIRGEKNMIPLQIPMVGLCKPFCRYKVARHSVEVLGGGI